METIISFASFTIILIGFLIYNIRESNEVLSVILTILLVSFGIFWMGDLFITFC